MKRITLVCLLFVVMFISLNCGKKAPPQPVQRENAEQESTRKKGLVLVNNPFTLNVESLEKLSVLVSG